MRTGKMGTASDFEVASLVCPRQRPEIDWLSPFSRTERQ